VAGLKIENWRRPAPDFPHPEEEMGLLLQHRRRVLRGWISAEMDLRATGACRERPPTACYRVPPLGGGGWIRGRPGGGGSKV